MKLRKWSLIVIIFSIFFTSLACNNTDVKNNSKESKEVAAVQSISKVTNLNKYDINVDLDIEKKTLSGNETLSYINKEELNLSEIYFHLYPNAFKTKETAPFLFNNFNNAYPLGFKPGSIDIKEVSAEGKKLQHSLSGEGDTILKVELNESLKPGSKIDLTIKFIITIPPAGERFGYKGDYFNFGNWYPVAAVYDKTGWNLDPYYAIGDPFYSDVSDYKVTIKTPEDYVVAATGDIVKEEIVDNSKIVTFSESCVRDFAWVTSNSFIVKESTVDGIKIKSYAPKEYKQGNESALKFAENAIKIYNEQYGKYPNRTYSVVGTTFPSGMEYPGIVFINSNYYGDPKSSNIMDIVITHETAHQWWYGAVGNDEIDEAWLDESMATYSEAIYFEKQYGKDNGIKYFNDRISSSFSRRRRSIKNGEVVLKTLSEFNSWDDYGPLVYNKGAIMLDTLRSKVGDIMYLNIVRTYYKTFMFKNATTDDFINIVETTTGQEWDSFFDEWLLDKKQ